MPRKNNLLLETQEARRDKEGFFPRFFEEEHYPAYTLISDIYPGELGDNVFVLSHQFLVLGNLIQWS